MITQNLKNKNIIIIGGSSGMGLAVAEMAFAIGASVTLTGTEPASTTKAAQQAGASVKSAVLDVDSEAQVEAFFKPLSGIDHIYVAAGSTKLGGVLENTLEENMKSFNTRIMGSLRVVRAAASKINPGGSFTFTGGVSTDRPISGAWVSGLGTSTAEQLARVLVMEFENIRFNAVSPGYTDTPMWDKILGENKKAVLESVAAKLPVKKIATPQEIASTVLFMMANPSITGETIHVDGGSRLI